MFRGDPGVDRHLFDDVLQFPHRHTGQFPPRQCPTSSGDAQFPGDVLGRQGVIAGDHHRANASGLTDLHGVLHLRARRVNHADQANESHLSFQLGFIGGHRLSG